MSTPVTTGIRDALKSRLSEEGEEILCTVYWVAAYDNTYFYDHEHIFNNKEEAEALLAAVNSRCLINGTPDADRFNPNHWGRQYRPNTPQSVQNDFMWEIKDAIAEGHHIPSHIVAAAGLC